MSDLHARLSLHNKSYRSEARVLVEVSAHLGINGAGAHQIYKVFLQEEFLTQDEART